MLFRLLLILGEAIEGLVLLPVALTVTGVELVGVEIVADPDMIAPPLGLLPEVGVWAEVVLGPLKLNEDPELLEIVTPRSTMVLTLYLAAFAEKSARSTTNCALPIWQNITESMVKIYFICFLLSKVQFTCQINIPLLGA